MNYFNKNRVGVVIVVVLMLINVSALVTIAANTHFFGKPLKEGATNRHRSVSKEDRGERMVNHFREKLGLNEKQVEQLKEFRREKDMALEELVKQMDSKRNEFNTQLGSEVVNRDELLEINSEIAQIDLDIRNHLLEFNLKLRSIMSPDQVKLYQAMHKNYQKRKRTSRGPSGMIFRPDRHVR